MNKKLLLISSIFFIISSSEINVYDIRKTNLNNDPVYEITIGGSYRIIENLNLPNKKTIIRINTSDVRLSLNKQTITGDSDLSTVGIEIMPGVKNIKISNGTIVSMHTAIDIKSNCSVTLENIKIISPTCYAIKSFKTTDLTLKNVSIVSPCKDVNNNLFGIYIENSNLTCLENCLVSNLKSSESITGICIKNCNSTYIKNCSTSDFNGKTAIGYLFENSILTKCESSETQGHVGQELVAGFSLKNETSSIIKNCSINTLGHKDTEKCYGICLEDSTGSFIEKNWIQLCTGKQVYGFVDFSLDSNVLLKANIFYLNGKNRIFPLVNRNKTNDTESQNIKLCYKNTAKDLTGLIMEVDSSMFKTLDLQIYGWTNLCITE